MLKFIAILACKIVCLIGKPLHKASALPGKIALKIDKSLLKKIKYPKNIICVTGSNGKTSTTDMISHIFKSNGYRVTCNIKGSNLLDGVATSIISDCDFKGKLKSDIVVLECDERYTRLIFKQIKPSHLVVLNLFRDQIMRNGSPVWIFKIIKEAINDDVHLILNADLPLVSSLGINRQNVSYFGIEKSIVNEVNTVYGDDFCPVCHQKLYYEYHVYGSLGKYLCEHCYYIRPKQDYYVSKYDKENNKLQINNEIWIDINFKSIYNIYNMIASIGTCFKVIKDSDKIYQAAQNYKLKETRAKEFELFKDKAIYLNTKTENAVTYDQFITYACNVKSDDVVVYFNLDEISKRYPVCNTSWLYDVNFSNLNIEKIKKIILVGKLAFEIYTAISYSDVDINKVVCFENTSTALKYLSQNRHNYYCVTTDYIPIEKIIKLSKRYQ